MPENDPPKLRVGSVLCRPSWATPALLGTQGQVFLKARRSKHRRDWAAYSYVSRVVVANRCTGELGAELAMGRTMTNQKTCRFGAPRQTIAPQRESQDPTVTFGGLGLVQTQADKPKCQVFGQR